PRDLDPQHDVRHPPAQRPHVHGLARGDAPGLAEVVGGRLEGHFAHRGGPLRPSRTNPGPLAGVYSWINKATRGRGGFRTDQKLSALMVSLPRMVAIPHQTAWATLLLTNRTEPSSKVTLTPPLWNELAPMMQWSV